MKQNEIITGGKYLFKTTIDDTKKDMVGKEFRVVETITGRKNNKAFFVNRRGKKPNKYLLDNGRYAKACELQNINNNATTCL